MYSKSVQWELSCSLRTDRDTTKLMLAFHNFGNALKNEITFRNCVLQSMVNLKPTLRYVLVALCQITKTATFFRKCAYKCEHVLCTIPDSEVNTSC